jgi:hypothetical protein
MALTEPYIKSPNTSCVNSMQSIVLLSLLWTNFENMLVHDLPPVLEQQVPEGFKIKQP